MIRDCFHYIKENILLVLIFLWVLVPFLSFSQVARVLALNSLLLFLLKYVRRSNQNIFFLILFYIFFTLVVNTIASAPSYYLRHFQLYILLILIFISLIVYEFPVDRKKGIFFIILFLNAVAIAGTISGLIEKSGAARILAKSSEEGIQLSEDGVGGYGVVYLNLLLIPILLYARKKTKRKFEQLLIYSNLIGAIVLVIMANFFIAISIMLFQLLVFFIIKNRISTLLLFILCVLLLLLISTYYIDTIDKFTFALVEGSNLRLKQIDIFKMLRGEASEYNTIYGRAERYGRSFIFFIKNPLIGTLSFDDIGKHSNILDQFAQFGLLIGCMLIYILRLLPITILNSVNRYERKYIIVFFISLIAVGMLNNYALHFGAAFVLAATIFDNKNINFNKKFI